jgi:16S rRNA (cytosine1402-N4)-methyltransferase
MYHVPVLLNESLNLLLHNKDTTGAKVYIDCTLGGGGCSEEILKRTSNSTKLIAIDRDLNAIEYAKERLSGFGDRISFLCGNFANIGNILETHEISKISGAVMDLGLSTYQLEHEPGFSYQADTELDMRSDSSLRIKAKDILNKSSEKDLLKIFRQFGELKYYRQVVRQIINSRKKKRFETTFDLVKAVKEKIPPRYLNKDLSKIFQALRIVVNNELENLREFLDEAAEFLEPGARLVALSYHSLEDRIVKNSFRSSQSLKVITKKPIIPSPAEIEANPKSRSAKLRAAEKKSPPYQGGINGGCF